LSIQAGAPERGARFSEPGAAVGEHLSEDGEPKAEARVESFGAEMRSVVQ